MSKKGPHILVVDDDKGILITLRSSLEQNGYVVYSAESGEEALEVFAQHRIDLIVLDLKLPDISGLEVCKKVREQAQVPIIILSVKDTEGDKVEADRKSTRLNSSHSQISYAVFCLKKKE